MHSYSDTEELATSNQKPSDDQVKDIKRLLIKPIKDLEIIEAEILDLRNRLSELESKRNETQKQISRYTLILSPIRRVPPDVLREIFCECLPTHRNPIMKSTEGPLLLTHVCSSWRAIAISSPRLWERLYITFTDDDTVPDLEIATKMAWNGELTRGGWQHALSKPEHQCRTAVLRRRYVAVRDWLGRSGTRPLSLSISFTSRYWYTVPYLERPPSVTREFLSFLVTILPRVKELEVNSSQPIYEALEQMVTVQELTSLVSLRIRTSSNFLSSSVDNFRPPAFCQAPNLRHLSVFANDARIWGVRDPSFVCQWGRLTALSCHDALTASDTIFLLEHASNLVHFKAVISDYDDEDLDFPVYEGNISLASLQTLSIIENVNPRILGDLYDRIDSPLLQSVTYVSYFYARPGQYSKSNPAPIPILPLLRKCTGLERLSVDTGDFTIWDLRLLLSVVPTITHLFVGPNQQKNEYYEHASASSFANYNPFDDSNTRLWSFRKLIVGHPSTGNEPPLLPRLVSLVISTATAQISEDIIFDIAKSRMIPTIGTAALKYVGVKFQKERTRDIVQELYHHAKSLDVKIKLNIEHAPPPRPEKNPVSLEFGLVGPDAGTWPYLDAGEDL